MFTRGGGRSLSVRFARSLLAAALLACCVAGAQPLRAQQIGEDLAGKLTEPQQRAYVFYLRARGQFDRDNEAYWAAVDERREARKRKRGASQPFQFGDYIMVQPPKYQGPVMPPDVAKIIAQTRTPAPPEPMPVVVDFLTHARTEFGFVPAPTTEVEFKRRYAEEALALGLSKDQVVRVYALETGGRGTYDMQAGIDPETRKGTPISSALGYAQLLGANSVNELAKHGESFISRLNRMAGDPKTSRLRAQQLTAKAVAVTRMLRAARAVPSAWAAHQQLARTPKGLGMHALNLDADIGPWLQAIKLKGVREVAEKAGRPNLSGAEIELMNLAGPQTGLDMMEPAGRNVPTANFFTQKAYERNPIVKDKTSVELLAALDSRMEANLVKAGSVEFARAFDIVLAARGGGLRR